MFKRENSFSRVETKVETSKWVTCSKKNLGLKNKSSNQFLKSSWVIFCSILKSYYKKYKSGGETCRLMFQSALIVTSSSVCRPFQLSAIFPLCLTFSLMANWSLYQDRFPWKRYYLSLCFQGNTSLNNDPVEKLECVQKMSSWSSVTFPVTSSFSFFVCGGDGGEVCNFSKEKHTSKKREKGRERKNTKLLVSCGLKAVNKLFQLHRFLLLTLY